ncbi:MAG: type IV pilus twitching motility protein PilT [Armatimonadota bacterium]
MNTRELLQLSMDKRASDLHLIAGEPPVLRIDGRLHRMEMPALTAAELERALMELPNDELRSQFMQDADINFAYSEPGLDRFRVNIHRQRGSVEAAFRRISQDIPKLDELGLPPIVEELTMRPNGLVLITGPVGMGKSTTLAAMVDHINRQRDSLIVSIEDPIEYLHTNRRSIIKQREVHSDTPSFAMALKNALRQDPNVIVVGELRDLESISIALTAAETGHLVMATLHTPDAAQTIQRIIDVFPAQQQAQVRTQLAESLRGIVSQLLLPDAAGDGMVLATEVLIVTPAMSNMLREAQIEQIPNFIQTGTSHGMQTMERSLNELVQQGKITCEAASAKVRYPGDFHCPVVFKPEPARVAQQPAAMKSYL